MATKIKNVGNSEKLDIGVNAWKLLTKPDSEFIYIEIKLEEQIELHVNPREVVFYILDGEGLLTVEEEQLHALKNDCIVVDAGKRRGWINTGNELLKLLVVKSLV